MSPTIYSEPWFVYIAECSDKSFYVGVAKDVPARIKRHNSENRCWYTRIRKPIILKYQESCSDYKNARSRETQIKGYSRVKKHALIEKFLP